MRIFDFLVGSSKLTLVYLISRLYGPTAVYGMITVAAVKLDYLITKNAR